MLALTLRRSQGKGSVSADNQASFPGLALVLGATFFFLEAVLTCPGKGSL
jgi:hypothetical protein